MAYKKNLFLRIIIILFIIVLPWIFFLAGNNFDYHTSVFCISITSICFWYLVILEDKDNRLLELKYFLMFPLSPDKSIRRIIVHFIVNRKYFILLIINVSSLLILRISFFFIASFILQSAFTILTAFVIREIFIKYNLRNHIGMIPGLSLLVAVLLLKSGNLKYMAINPFTSLFCIPLYFQTSGNYLLSGFLYLCFLILFPFTFLIIKIILKYGYNPSDK
jgi:hypothetical protein